MILPELPPDAIEEKGTMVDLSRLPDLRIHGCVVMECARRAPLARIRDRGSWTKILSRVGQDCFKVMQDIEVKMNVIGRRKEP